MKILNNSIALFSAVRVLRTGKRGKINVWLFLIGFSLLDSRPRLLSGG